MASKNRNAYEMSYLRPSQTFETKRRYIHYASLPESTLIEPSPVPPQPPPTLPPVSQPAHGAEILSLAYSPMLVPHLAGSPPTTTPSTSPPSSGEREPALGGVSGEIPRYCHNAVTAPAGVRVSATLATMVQTQDWEAIDPLDPNAAQKLMRPREVGASMGLTGDSEDSGSGGRSRGNKSCCHYLVMLATASRDSLVRVFDASAEGGPTRFGSRRGEEQAERTAMEGGQRMSPRSEEKGEVRRRLPLMKTLENHSSNVTVVKFSKDGKRCSYVTDWMTITGAFCGGGG